ncbi:GNAT family N-acetyltransferase [Kitasatospora sp. NPDC018619]|uniref:GNAT family N-acetyltransferase n=1 Tax=unclassified Kitasatospora TaxID=2633591 RepID=UPI00379E10E5
MDVEIRTGTSALQSLTCRTADVYQDWPRIWPVWQRVVSAGETHPYPVDATEKEARALWLDPHRSVVHIAEADGELLAAMMTKPLRYGPGDHVANFDLMVNPDHWGKGVGRILADHVIDATRTAGYHAMEAYAVVETNHRALRLWQSLGFQSMAVVPEAFRHPRFGLTGVHLMRRSLQS